MSESNPQIHFTHLGESLGCMVDSQAQREGGMNKQIDWLEMGKWGKERCNERDRYGGTYKSYKIREESQENQRNVCDNVKILCDSINIQ